MEIILTRRAPEIVPKLNGHARYVDDQAAPRLLLEDQSGGNDATVAVRLAQTLELLVGLGVPGRSVESQSAYLDRLFLDLSGRGLRD